MTPCKQKKRWLSDEPLPLMNECRIRKGQRTDHNGLPQELKLLYSHGHIHGAGVAQPQLTVPVVTK